MTRIRNEPGEAGTKPGTSDEANGALLESNPFAPPTAGLPEAMAGAWRRHGVAAGALLVAILVGDLSYALGFTWLGVASLSARMVFLLNGSGFVVLAVVERARGRRDRASECLASGIVFLGTALVSVPPLLLLDRLLDLK